MSAAPRVVGWREWVALPELGLLAVHAKADTGAETSALHAEAVEPFSEGGAPWVRFTTRPLLRRALVVACVAPVVDERHVTASSGHGETRRVVRTLLRLGVRTDAPAWPVEVTLADRRAMRYPMLLGREALAGRLLVDPAAEHLLGEIVDPRAFYG
jgi:hypothetical protein